MKLNFKELKVWNGVAHRESYTMDIREMFADQIYSQAQGIPAKSLAFKIYGSDGAVDYSDKEVELIMRCAEALCTPKFSDAILEMIENAKKEIEQ